MKGFRWLHISDLHFEGNPKYTIADIRDSFFKKLQQVREQRPFDYVFITGDLADKNNYIAADENINALKNCLNAEGCVIFWAPGNHDIARDDHSYRSRLIADIRNEKLSYEVALQNDESRMLLLRVFNEYLKKNNQLLGYTPSSPLHNFYSCQHLDIIVLNTSATSCNDEDNGDLFLLEANLISLFNQHQKGRPLFVLGHHDLSSFNPSEQRDIAMRFDHSNVDLYLCGHQHQLSFDNIAGLSRNIPQCIVGGGTSKDYCDFSFLVGDYNAESNSFHISPYLYNKHGNRQWNLDYSYLPRLIESNETLCSDFSNSNNVIFDSASLLNLYNECKRISLNGDYSSICPDSSKRRFYLFALSVLLHYEQKRGKGFENQDLKQLCNTAVECEAFNAIDFYSISYLSNDVISWFEVYRGFINTCRLISIITGKAFSTPEIPIAPFDFSNLYKITDHFDTSNTCYILVTNSLHDIPAEQLDVLANMPWNVIIDFDGTTDKGGLRQFQRRGCKSLLADITNIGEIVYTRDIPIWMTFSDSFCYDYSSESEQLTFGALKIIYRKLATKLKESFSGDCTVIFINKKDKSDNLLISELSDRFAEACKFIFVSSSYDVIESEISTLVYDEYGNPLKNYFAYSTNIYGFLGSLFEYRDSLNIQPTILNFTKCDVPTIDGPKPLSSNMSVNLSDYFEVLSSDIGTNLSDHIENREKFYKGNLATWDLFSQNDVINIMHPEVYKYYLESLRKSMASKQENPRGHIFNLLHTAGYGGTTLSRQIAWDLHNSHPVVLVHHYQASKFVALIRQLYDQHTRMGILLIADENNLTANELESIENDSMIIDRPIALLIIKRDRNPQREIKSKRVLRLNIISFTAVQNLKNKFSAVSSLSKNELNKKYKEFDYIFHKNNTPKCPFFIGLYFLEKDFEGLYSYTKNILHDLQSTNEIETLAMLSFIDCYSGLGVPQDFITKFISVTSKGTYLSGYPYAAEAFINTRHTSYNINLVKGRNYLLSEELLEQCTNKLFDCTVEERLKYYSEKLIDAIAACCKNGVSEYYHDLLEKIFITKYVGDSSATEDSFYATDFSNLIIEIPSPESKETIFQKLVETYNPIITNLSADDNFGAYRMLAHFWGHFGRLYRSKELGSFTNYEKSIDCCKKAEDIMQIIERHDPYIYHMHGDSICRKCFDLISKYNDVDSTQETVELDGMVAQAIYYFERSMQYGEIGRGALSTLDILMAYLKLIFKIKGINTPKDFSRLTSLQLQYENMVEEYIILLDEIPKDYRGNQIFGKLKNDFRSTILYRDFGEAIQYYENKIVFVQNKQGSDSYDLYQLRRALANVLIEKYKNDYGQVNSMINKDAKRITDLLEQNIHRTVSPTDIYDRRQKSVDCYKWFLYAPYGNSSISEALIVSDKWKYLDNINGRYATPLPYYYEYVLLVLRLLEGYETSKQEILESMRISYTFAQNTRYNTNKIRDILVQGVGMSQIKRFHGFSSLKENFSIIEPMSLEGKFTKVIGTKYERGLGLITITKPINLRGIEVVFKMGKGNTIQENQTSHILNFYVGFTCERIVAFDHLIADITAGEVLSAKLEEWRKSQ